MCHCLLYILLHDHLLVTHSTKVDLYSLMRKRKKIFSDNILTAVICCISAAQYRFLLLIDNWCPLKTGKYQTGKQVHSYCPLIQHLNKMSISGCCALNKLLFIPLKNMNNGHVSCVKTGQKRKRRNAQAACRLNTFSTMDVDCEAGHVKQKAVKGGNEAFCAHTVL